MPLHLDTQGAGPVGAAGIVPDRVKMPMNKAVLLSYFSAAWHYNANDGKGWQSLAVTGEYKPPFRVRGILIPNSAATYGNIVVDLSGDPSIGDVVSFQTAIPLTLSTNVIHEIQVTKVYTDQSSYANNLVILG